MTSPAPFKIEDFIESKWEDDFKAKSENNYYALGQTFSEKSDAYAAQGDNAKHSIMKLLKNICSFSINPSSINRPYSPSIQLVDRRSTDIEDITVEDLIVLDLILEHTENPLLRARLADVLWLTNKKISHARIALRSYIELSINPKEWMLGLNRLKERGIRLAFQIRDINSQEELTTQLLSFFKQAIDDTESSYAALNTAELIIELGIASSATGDIALNVFAEADSHKIANEFRLAREYYATAEKAFQILQDQESQVQCMFETAKCLELEAESRASGNGASNIAASSFYENAIQAYRRIPSKFRNQFKVEQKLEELRHKLRDTGTASIHEMGLISTNAPDTSESAKVAIGHVSNKESFDVALMFFSGLPRLNHEELKKAHSTGDSFIMDMLAHSRTISSDGRTVAKSPPLMSGEEISEEQLLRFVGIHIQHIVQGSIIPALNQLLLEFTITPKLLKAICHHSSLVPEDREEVIAYGLWCGFEWNFAIAIHILAPQLEHIVREQLKNAEDRKVTTTLDRNGIETENSLNTLMAIEGVDEILGPNNCFNITTLFTNPIGANLRNDVAHGLINDKSGNSFESIYAWWFILSLIMRSLINAKPE